MSADRRLGVPIREGFVVTKRGEESVWLEHRWNNGEVTRSWFVDPAKIDIGDIHVRDLSGTQSDQ